MLWLCRVKLYTCARLAKKTQSVSPSKTVSRCMTDVFTLKSSFGGPQHVRSYKVWLDRVMIGYYIFVQ